MATMIKRKREKNKTKQNKSVGMNQLSENEKVSVPSSSSVRESQEIKLSDCKQEHGKMTIEDSKLISLPQELLNNSLEIPNTDDPLINSEVTDIVVNENFKTQNISEINYSDLSEMIFQDLVIESRPNNSAENNQEVESEAHHFLSVTNLYKENVVSNEIESATPSAPIFHEESTAPVEQCNPAVEETTPVLEPVPLEEAIRLFAAKEIAELKSMSEREEAFVEGGPLSGPEHPLVDLLSTFKRSLSAMEKSRLGLACARNEEEKLRSQLWKIEKRTISMSEKCNCGTMVDLRATYEHAELLKEKLPVARMRLEGLLRDVQDSYCQHQHAALLAHCQIDELISDVCQGNKHEIRECLALIFQALRLSDTSSEALTKALTRWAKALSCALLKGRDWRQLVFLFHYLFRQSHSVHWAASVITVTASDTVEAAKVIALLDLLLNRTRLEAAIECTEEETEEAWEEVDKWGSGGAVAEGNLRERDLLALLDAFPLRALAARLMMISNSNVSTLADSDLTDPYYGRGVLQCCYGLRLLLSVLRRAVSTHASYGRLRSRLCDYACHCMRGLAMLHLKMMASDNYQPQLLYKVTAELEAVFVSGEQLLRSHSLHQLPASLLRDEAAWQYTMAYVDGLHATSPCKIPLLRMETANVSCGVRVRVVSGAAASRPHDHALASACAQFLVQTGLCKKAITCKGGCEEAARECVPELLKAHPYLHTIILNTVGELAQSNAIDPAHLTCLCLPQYRDTASATVAVLDKWRLRPPLLAWLLGKLDYTPHTGLSLDTQLAISNWLADWILQAPPPAPDWPWLVLRKLRTHRTYWQLPLDAPPPHNEPEGLFQIANALLSSSWGHCIPLICSQGVSGLLRLATSRPEDAIHCLAPLMLVMSHSPVSVSLTPQFTEVFNALLLAGPTLVQRALGRGGPSGAHMLQELMVKQVLEDSHHVDRGAILSAWLHALFQTSNAAALAALDACVRASRLWSHVDSFLQEPLPAGAQSLLLTSACAPLLSEACLRSAHAHEASRGLTQVLSVALHSQRVAGAKIHVDNALLQIGSSVRSEDLTIYKTATVALSAPFPHPAHLTIWRLFLHLYLQRPHNGNESSPPIGPLFFSGIIKSRTMTQLKKRLQDAILYHRGQSEVHKTKPIEKPPDRQIRRNRERTVSNKEDNQILPPLSINDLIRDSSESESESGDEIEEVGDRHPHRSEKDGYIDSSQMVLYHGGAEKLLTEYARWLEEGEKTRAMPFHADLARFISEQALSAAWWCSVRHVLPPPPPASAPAAPSPLPAHSSHAQIVANSLKDIPERTGPHIYRLKSPLEGVNFTDARSLLNLVDRYLKEIETLASEWSAAVSNISSLDNKLLELVAGLRVRRQLPPLTKKCPQNTCPPVTLCVSDEEWCISVGAERGIVDNRVSACNAVKKLSRPRPESAVTAAALISIARRVRSIEAATRVIETAWKAAGRLADCAIAADAIAAIVEDLIERWLSNDGRLCSEMLTRWSNSRSSLQQTLCGYLVNPRRLRFNEWTNVYVAVVDSKLPSHVVFSHLSKFEMSRWAESADDSQRQELVDCILKAVQRWGPEPDEQHHMFLELCGVHLQSIVSANQLRCVLLTCTKLSVNRSLPVQCWTHVANVCANVGAKLPFDQLGHLLRELGILWWEARSGGKSAQQSYTAHAPQVATVLRVMQRAFVGSAVALSYAPERVALYAWSSLQESWSPWVAPHPSPPLVPVADETGALMLKSFLDALCQVMLDCPGTETQLLREVFQWVVQLHLSLASAQECRLMMSSLLNELGKLPWTEYQWIDDKCIRAVVQVCNQPDESFLSWCSGCWRDVTAQCWASNMDVAKLAALLLLFTTTSDPPLPAVSGLPWARLPEPALREAYERFFAARHSLTTPYHTLPQFTVLLVASGFLCALPAAAHFPRSHRAAAVSLWTRAASVPGLRQHVPAMQERLLEVIADIAPSIENSPCELEELLSRALVVMCIEPAATEALPVWQGWISAGSKRLVCATLSASCSLTTFEYFASIAEVAAKACMQFSDSSWSEIRQRWSTLHWRDATALVARSSLHAGYAVVDSATSPDQLRTALLALLALSLDFVQNETILSLWICLGTRHALSCGETEVEQDCRAAAAALVSRWAEPPRRSLLRTIGLQADTDRPTSGHRLLCRFAQCLLTPNSEPTLRAFEAACAAHFGSNPGDVPFWGRSPSLNKLVRLAMRLHPNCDRYFKLELETVMVS